MGRSNNKGIERRSVFLPTIFAHRFGVLLYKSIFVLGSLSGDTSYYAFYCPLDRSVPTRYIVHPLKDLFSEVSYIQISSQTTDEGGPIAWIGSDGAQETIQAVDLTTGEVLRQYKLNIPLDGDWESVGMGPCTAKKRSATCLYFGNVGNNDAHECRDRSCLEGRATATIYKLEEPDLSQPTSKKRLNVASIIVDYNHPGMPTVRADSEALFIDPVGDEKGGEPGDIYLITKFPYDPHLQRLVKVPNDHKKMNIESGEIRRFSLVPLGTPFSASGESVWKGGDISENGALISLTDGDQLHFFPRPQHISVAEAVTRPSCVYRSDSEIGGNARQYETVAFRKGSVAETSECRNKKACTLSINEYELVFSSPEPRLVLPDETFAPTISPPPTNAPTGAPTKTPSENPTPYPTPSPTAEPSASPSSAPTGTPSASPTLSMVPTISPSSQPSGVPSDKPSSSPSSLPSAIPTSAPSSIPSAIPSGIPSSHPSSTPSRIPTSSPSDAPSIMPSISISPSDVPTDVPSSTPSVAPTLSIQPSGIPTAVPSASPTESTQPSLAPYQPYFGRQPNTSPVKRMFSLDIELKLIFDNPLESIYNGASLSDGDRLLFLDSVESNLRYWYSKDLNMDTSQYEMQLSEKKASEKRTLIKDHFDDGSKESTIITIFGTFVTYERSLTRDALTISTMHAFDSYPESFLSRIMRTRLSEDTGTENALTHLLDVIATTVNIQESAHLVIIGAKSPALVAFGYGLLSFALVGFCASMGYLLNEREHGHNNRDYIAPDALL